nr:odorant receptor 32 [Achelura yunnanensis]
MASNTNSRAITSFRRICLYAYITGLPYFWYEEPKWSVYVDKFHKMLTFISNVINCLFYGAEFFSFFTQKNLTERQTIDQIIFTLSNPFIFWNCIAMTYYKEEVRALIHSLVLFLPSVYNDKKVERKMAKKSRLYVGLLLSTVLATLLLYGIDNYIRSFKGGVFTTIITAWPKVEDTSQLAGIGRVLVYIVWIEFMFRVCGAVSIVMSLTINTSHQYIQLQSYFHSLNNIFQEKLSQEEKEKKYEAHLKVGIQQHIKILSLTNKLKKTCMLVYGCQIIINMIILVMCLLVMVSGNMSFTKLMSYIGLALCSTTTNGFYMCTIGDITVEASNLTSAMYCSGWENCGRGSSLRVRKLLGVAMAQTQNPLIIKTLGLVPVSYSSYLSIIKSSYSVFSVIY